VARKSRTHLISDVSTPETIGSELAPRHLTKLDFGRRLHRMLLERGWRQSEFARRAGIQRDSVSVYIRGRSFPTPLNLGKMARALGIQPEELLPNHTEAAIDDDAPDFELKVSPGDISRAWVRLNRLVSLETAVKIAALVEADAASRKDK